MKKNKLVLLSCILLAGLIAGTTACKKKDTLTQLVKAFYLSGNHIFTTYAAYVFLAGNITTLELQLPAENTQMYVQMKGTTTGTYSGTGTFTDPGYITLTKNGVNYSSNTAGGSATINWTKRDDSDMWIEGTFSGTLVNQTNPVDKFDLTSGTFAMKFQF